MTNPWRTGLLGFLVLAALATLTGLLILRPTSAPTEHTSPDFDKTYALNQPQVEGTVATVDNHLCSDPHTGRAFDEAPLIPAAGDDTSCTRALIELTTGQDAGRKTQLVFYGVAGEPTLAVGEDVMLSRSDDGTYAFADYRRGGNLTLWAIIAAIIIIGFAAWHGLRALLGLGISLAIVLFYLIPSLVEGHAPLPLALVTCAAIIFIVVPLVHGVNWKSASALGGALVALGVAGAIGWASISSTALTGASSEENLKLLLYMPGVPIVGVLLCGFIVGALGSLNDIAVAQASTVRELHAADPTAGPGQLFASAMKVGRDHIASMVYTIVLTYTGAALPLLMLITAAQRPVGQILSSDLVATEVMRSLLGAMALTLAVPLTTAIAAFTMPEGRGRVLPQSSRPRAKHRR
ncbi:YibE/F family protein [Corynebacterium sp. B5-R-101]|uniref:YibE/F family protein n=1 Tax=Corynebacterium intestinale TaxID=2943492 RepID=A0ABT0TA30_9CORY|nr:YibE/F family protein [Corynebacterium intestinale]MCL8493936.1 YibE/F family protein [Corynebacterium intestinale]MCP1390172.1 YibE/F family protein [Corynebacterium intestinale]